MLEKRHRPEDNSRGSDWLLWAVSSRREELWWDEVELLEGRSRNILILDISMMG